MAAPISLSRQAGEKRAEAQTKFDDLSAAIQAQIGGGDDAESKLSHEEITTRREEIETLLSEAKSLQGVDTLEGVMTAIVEDGTPAAKEMLNEIATTPAERQKVWNGIGQFMRAIRTTSGKYDYPEALTPRQMLALQHQRTEATKFSRGDNMHAKEFVGPDQTLSFEELKALVGDDTGSDGRGDFLVPRDTRPLHSFAAVTKIAEGAQKPEREPTFEQLVLTAIKYAAYVEASDELLMDSIVDLPPVLVELLTSAIAYEYDRDCIRGVGTTEPQGYIGSTAEFALNRTVAGEVNIGDVFAMESRFFGDNGIYLYHPSVITELYALNASNVIVWNADLASGAPGILFGRPLIKSHKLPVLGVKGDFSLVDPSFYLVGDLQSVAVANSMHFQFRNDVTAWRATFRGAGTPWPAAPFSHEATGGNFVYRVSPFVVLDLVATS